MRILIVNPNTTAAMTDKIAVAARAAAAAGTEIVAATSAEGPASIEGYFDGALSLPGLLDEIRKGEADGVDAHVGKGAGKHLVVAFQRGARIAVERRLHGRRQGFEIHRLGVKNAVTVSEVMHRRLG